MNATNRSEEVATVILELVRMLVDHPEQVVVEPVDGTQVTLVEVKTARGDFGKVVGRGGRTIGAVREILAAASGKLARRFTLELLEPDEAYGQSVAHRFKTFAPAAGSFEDDPVGATAWLLTRIVRLMVDNPGAVEVRAIAGHQVVAFELEVDPCDTRYVVGVRGKKADALRTLLSNLGARAGRTFLLEIVELIERVERADASPPAPLNQALFGH